MVAKTEREREGLRAAGRLVRRVFDQMKGAARPGVSTAELDGIAGELLSAAGAHSAPQYFYDFPGYTCISVNEEAAHGIPGPRRLRAGDLVNIDVSAVLDGYVADMGQSFLVGPTPSRPGHRARQRICTAVEAAVTGAIARIRPGTSLNVIGQAVQAAAAAGGYEIVRNLGSHGVGRNIHEEPSYVPIDNPSEARILEEGLVFTVEPFFTTGRPWVKELADGWTLAVEPGALVAQFEHTVLVGRRGAEVLTA